MFLKIRRSSIEICVLAGCFLVVLITVMQILALSHKPYKTEVSEKVSEAVEVHGSTQRYTDTRKKTNSDRETAKLKAQAKIKLRNKIRMELKALEKALSRLRTEKSSTPEESNLQIQNMLYARRVIDIIQKAETEGSVPLTVNITHLGRPPSYIKTQMHRTNTNSSESAPRKLDYNIHVPYPAKEFGVPLEFQSALTTQEIANEEFARRTSVPLKHFKDLDKSEENELKNVITVAETFREENMSTSYEDNFMKVKKQFQEGTELYVNEDSLRMLNSNSQDICPRVPESLVGNSTELELNVTLDIDDIVNNNTDVMAGGEWKPSTCISRYRVAIIIPYRDRWNHLKVLLHYLVPTLKRQLVHFRIFVVEQYGNETFNKGRIMNAAFKEALKLFDFQCVTFHDVDLVPEDDRNMYTCTEQPKHMSHGIDKFKYILPYQGLVGGVLMFKREHFQLVNGYSNMYWGWGAEDDDMTTRILYHGLRIYRPPSNIAKYKMVKHDGRKTSEVAVRMRLLRSAAKRSKLEGLNNVKYSLLSTNVEKMFTHFIVDIGVQ